MEAVVAEALECHGGSGYVEDQPIARLYREAPLNGIWEGTAAMMGLDVVRALHRDPVAQDALLTELRTSAGDDTVLRTHVDHLASLLHHHRDDLEPHARRIMGMAAVAWQAGLLLHHSTPEVAETFIRSRTGEAGSFGLGTLDGPPAALDRIVDRVHLR